MDKKTHADSGATAEAGLCRHGLYPWLDVLLWGKEHSLERGAYPVVCHMLDTGAVFLELWKRLLGPAMQNRIADALGLSTTQAAQELAFWAALHDLGKISPGFQARLREQFSALVSNGSYVHAPGGDDPEAARHEKVTHWTLTGLLEELGYTAGQEHRAVARRLSHAIAQLLGGHHGCFYRLMERAEVKDPAAALPQVGEAEWQEQRRRHVRVTRELLAPEGPIPSGVLPAELAVVVLGAVMIADWLASSVKAIEAVRLPPEEWCGCRIAVAEHWRRTRAQAPLLIRQAGLGRCAFEPPSLGGLLGKIDRHLPSPLPPEPQSPLARDLEARLPNLLQPGEPGLVLISAPDSERKRELGLYAAALLGQAVEARGLAVALPVASAVDAASFTVESFAQVAMRGNRALTQLHVMAWESDQTSRSATHAMEEVPKLSLDDGPRLIAEDWLFNRRRGHVAPIGVGTLDQFLSAVLPLPDNAAHLFGLSEKVVVIEEAQAQGAWTHRLLCLLLEWLGAMRAPVVLLSSTLTGRSATALVRAYRDGARVGRGLPSRDDDEPPSVLAPPYPGWLFLGGEDERVVTSHRKRPKRMAPGTSNSESSGAGLGVEPRLRTLRMKTQRVQWDVADSPTTANPRRRVPVQSGGRRRALREALGPVARQGGCALVCCMTVTEAQQTFRDLQQAFPQLAARDGGLRLLHGRHSELHRREITAACMSAYGLPRPEGAPHRPRSGSILIATPLITEGFALDVDLVVTDLAPMAALLAGAAHCCRGERGRHGRPSWAGDERRPRVIVLEPAGTDGQVVVPRAWEGITDPGLLSRTSKSLARTGGGIAVPADVQRLIQEVYDTDEFVHGLNPDALVHQRRLDAARRDREASRAYQAQITGVPSPGDIHGNLYELTRRERGVTAELLATRMGADVGRIVCMFPQPNGTHALDPEGTTPLERVRSKGRSSAAVSIARNSIPVPDAWLRSVDPEDTDVPDINLNHWRKRPILRGMVPVLMKPTGHADALTGQVFSGHLGDSVIMFSNSGVEKTS